MCLHIATSGQVVDFGIRDMLQEDRDPGRGTSAQQVLDELAGQSRALSSSRGADWDGGEMRNAGRGVVLAHQLFTLL